MGPGPDRCGARYGDTGYRRGRHGRANDSGSHRRRKAPASVELDAFEAATVAPSARDSGSHRRRKAPASEEWDAFSAARGAPSARVPAAPPASRSEVSARGRRTGLALAGLTAIALAGAADGAPPVAFEAESPPGILVGVGLHRLHIHCTGQGSPSVVFESGLGGTSLDWTRVQPEVSRFTRACSYDRAGYGWSERGPEPRHADRIALELDRLLLHANVSPPYLLVGHSFGGLAIRLFAARNEPRAVAGIVLVDATHEHQFQRMESAGVQTPMAPTGRRFVISNHWLVPSALPESLKPLAQRLALARKSIRTLYGELGSLRHSAIQVGSIRRTPDAPVIVLARGPRRGADDSYDRLDGTWLDLQRELAGTMKNGSFQVVRGSGHYIHLERPERVVDAIRTIVDRYRRGRASAADRR